MDPNACYDSMLQNIAEKNWAEATENARNLYNWLVRGGFVPQRPVIRTQDIPSVHDEPAAAGLASFVTAINYRLIDSLCK